jgi:hypothetical protein
MSISAIKFSPFCGLEDIKCEHILRCPVAVTNFNKFQTPYEATELS